MTQTDACWQHHWRAPSSWTATPQHPCRTTWQPPTEQSTCSTAAWPQPWHLKRHPPLCKIHCLHRQGIHAHTQGTWITLLCWVSQERGSKLAEPVPKTPHPHQQLTHCRSTDLDQTHDLHHKTVLQQNNCKPGHYHSSLLTGGTLRDRYLIYNC